MRRQKAVAHRGRAGSCSPCCLHGAIVRWGRRYTRSVSVRTRLGTDQRREQIIGQGTRIFRDTPYADVSVDQLAAAAGVTRGLLHHYFGSKRALYLVVLERTVRVPPSVRLVPEGAEGDLRAVVAECVASWLRLIRAAGGLWPGAARGTGFAEADVDEIVTAARDELVERMLVEVPFPPDLDRDLLRSALR